MESSKHNPQTNFWFGFAMGIMTGGGLSLILGTNKGRTYLKKLLEMSENFEENLIPLIEEVCENFAEKGLELKKEIGIGQPDSSKNIAHTNTSTLNLILEKIKSLSPKPSHK